jgi:dTDP-4-dehydrorhamnose reductase
MRNSDVVVNFIGKHYETKHLVPTRRGDGSLSRVNFSFEDVHVTAAADLAELAKEAGVKTFIQISSVSADANSTSKWSRTKMAGEMAVREKFPEAVRKRFVFLCGLSNFVSSFRSRSL